MLKRKKEIDSNGTEWFMSEHLIGEFNYNIDNKGRVIMPPKFRTFLGDSFIITRGLDGCLFVFSEKEWQRIESKLSVLPLTDQAARSFTRFFFASATKCSLDKQGRVMLPVTLRNHANLDKTAVVVGINNRIEIWNAQRWEENIMIDPNNFVDRMADLGI